MRYTSNNLPYYLTFAVFFKDNLSSIKGCEHEVDVEVVVFYLHF